MRVNNKLNSILYAIRSESERIFGEKLVDVILYGSYARGDYNGDSDIDIMLKLDIEQSHFSKYRWEISKITSELDMVYDVFVSVHLQENTRFEKYKDVLPFYRNVALEGVSVNG